MREQVAETRASTALFTEQTEILKRQQSVRDQEQADEEFDEMVTALKAFVFSNDGGSFRAELTEGADGGRQIHTFTILTPNPMPDIVFFGHYRRGITSAIASLRKSKMAGKHIAVPSTVLPIFVRILADLKILLGKAPFLSPSHQVKAITELEETVKHTTELRDILAEL